MAVAKRKIGHRAELWCDDGAGTAGYTKVANIVSITPPGQSREKVDATIIEDDTIYNIPSGPYDLGDLAFKLIWDMGDTTHTMLDTLMASGDIVNWKIVYKMDPSIEDTFEGWVLSNTPGPLDGKTRIERDTVVCATSAITRA